MKEHLEQLPSSFDAVHQLCKKIPLSVISSLLGFPPERASAYVADGLKVVQSLDPYFSFNDLLEMEEAAQRLTTFISETISDDDYKHTPLAKALETLGEEDGEVDQIAFFAFLFIAGFETTSTLLATCLHQLLKHPDYAAKIREAGSSVFVKEILRTQSPVQITGRRTTSALSLGDIQIPPNSVLTVCIGAANTDPAYFDPPLQINWHRQKTHHLSFGYGVHHCLGSQLAEIEASIFVEEVMKKFSSMKLVEEPVYEDKFAVKSFQSMKVALQ